MTDRWACILGQPVRYSLSPALHNAAFAHAGLAAHYEAHDVGAEDLQAAVEALRDPACLGANVTAPHKERVMPLLEALAPEAELLGAVNTIVNRDGRLAGDNTDLGGLVRWFREGDVGTGARRALVLGAGGAARSVLGALAALDVPDVTILNRTPARAEALVEHLRPRLGDMRVTTGPLERAARPADTPEDLVVNATSLGHHGGAPAIHPSWFARHTVAVDLVYNPPETPFLANARRLGLRAENGLGMLIHQAILAFELWTGQTIPYDVYERAALAALAASNPSTDTPQGVTA